MTVNSITHGFKARRDEFNRGWIAEFYGPDGIGYRTVLGSDGTVKLHPSKLDAERAAMAAMCLSMDERSRARSPRTKTFDIFKSGKLRKAVAVTGAWR